MMDFFKPQDFEDSYKWNDNYRSPLEAISEKANEKLSKLIESWPVVYGRFEKNEVTQTFGSVQVMGDTHRTALDEAGRKIDLFLEGEK